MRVEIDRKGATRTVLLIGKFAIKFPGAWWGSPYHIWRSFLNGLIANMEETHWWRTYRHTKFCPVLFAIPGGFLVIMPRCRILTPDEYVEWMPGLTAWLDEPDFVIPSEPKFDSYGWLQGRIVTVDYGN